MNYRTIHTTYGLQRMAQAESTGVSINLTQIAVGDGGGNPVTPDEERTGLVREMFRAPVNRVYQDPDTPTKFTAEMVIPATEGGFVLREVGVFDETGGLFAIGNLPDTYKPNASEGAYADTVVRMEFLVTNADVVTIQIDPNVAVASQTWVINNVTPCSLFPGGTTGQVLRKKSNGCGDTEWAAPDDVNVTVDMIEERQTLAASQTTVTMSVTTTRGLAVYIEGVRIPKGSGVDEWAIAGGGTSTTQIVLGRSYPAGTRILLTQNEPTGAAPSPLERSLNLADVPNKVQGRANLGVHSIDESNAAGQPGDIKYTARNTAPTGWLKANGAAVSRTAYAALFSAIGTRFGAGDGFNTFNLPDLRGEFIRCWDDGRGVDSSRALGSFQGDEFRSHTHKFKMRSNGATTNDSYSDVLKTGDPNAYAGTTEATGGNETRPRNIAMLACIKF